ncbi:uncharacterized protein LOC126899674 [Daktulosphaira vitifoliae]|uniref:uncharacterized protein LOC126899674 n=1 Tax=Daktulosphaira vitifoliae TaxID=58002 RepID=UPI0021A9DD41|nr:uncharacterized protein LOC126899674 [Daktulosphaira vitifoliae]
MENYIKLSVILMFLCCCTAINLTSFKNELSSITDISQNFYGISKGYVHSCFINNNLVHEKIINKAYSNIFTTEFDQKFKDWQELIQDKQDKIINECEKTYNYILSIISDYVCSFYNKRTGPYYDKNGKIECRIRVQNCCRYLPFTELAIIYSNEYMENKELGESSSNVIYKSSEKMKIYHILENLKMYNGESSEVESAITILSEDISKLDSLKLNVIQ